MNKSAFTMVELIFVIVIIGVLASVAVPKLSGLTDGAKKSAEIATISAVATALESANGEWSINEGNFTWGNHQASSLLNSKGYPNDLSKNGEVFGAILKGKNSKFDNHGGLRTSTTNGVNYAITIFTGPASDPSNGVRKVIPNKPNKNDFWIYTPEINGTSCTYGSKDFYSGDIQLIENVANPNYTTITFTSCTP